MRTSIVFASGLLIKVVLSTIISQLQSPLSPIPLVDLPPTTASSSPSLDSLLELHQTLIEYSSITGTEPDIERFLITYLQARNFTTERQEVTPATTSQPARANILAYLGTTRQTRVLISSHIDTVPPFSPYNRRGDEIWGRGSVDAKGCVATQTQATIDLVSSRDISEGDVALLFVVGEETGGDGMKAANALGLAWESVIFGEPTALKLAAGHKGMLGVTLHAKGKAGHSGYPELGRNANAMLLPALYEIGRLELEGSEKFGETTLNYGLVRGGVAANVIAEEAEALLAIRVAGGTIEGLKRRLREAVDRTPWGVEIEMGYMGEGYEPVDIDCDIDGFNTTIVNYGTDIPNLQGKHKRYLYGPGDILVAHSDHEFLTVGDLERALDGYKRILKGVLGR